MYIEREENEIDIDKEIETDRKTDRKIDRYIDWEGDQKTGAQCARLI